MMRLAALALVGAALTAHASVTNFVDVSALAAAADNLGLATTNGWELSGLDRYGAGCVKFNSLGDSLLSPDFHEPVIRIEALVRCSATSNVTRRLHVLDGETDADFGQFALCSAKDRLEPQCFEMPPGISASRIRFKLDGRENTGVWGIGSLEIVTASSAVAPANLRVSHAAASNCEIAWENGANTISNRIDSYLVEHDPTGETVLFSTDFETFSARGNPVRMDGVLPALDAALSGMNVYAPANANGICQVGKGDAIGIVRWAGVDDYAGVSLRMMAKRHPTDAPETTVSYELDGVTNTVETVNLPDEFDLLTLDLSAVPFGSAILLGYYTTKRNHRMLIDSLAIVRSGAERTTLIGSCWIQSAQGLTAFSTRDSIKLSARANVRFVVRALNADGMLSSASQVETRIGFDGGGILMLK